MRTKFQAGDITLNRVGFFTDNGAQTYGDQWNPNSGRGTERGRELNLTCCNADVIKPVFDRRANPETAGYLNYLQLDVGITFPGWGDATIY